MKKTLTFQIKSVTNAPWSPSISVLINNQLEREPNTNDSNKGNEKVDLLWTRPDRIKPSTFYTLSKGF